MENYLMHHGVQGMKWGVQNGPPYPLGNEAYNALSNNVIKKGSELYRIASSDEPLDNKRKYVATSWNAKVQYDEEATEGILPIKSDKISSYTYEALKDLKYADAKDIGRIFKDVKVSDLGLDDVSIKYADKTIQDLINEKEKGSSSDSSFIDKALGKFGDQYFEYNDKGIQRLISLGYDIVKDVNDYHTDAAIVLNPSESLNLKYKYDWD